MPNPKPTERLTLVLSETLLTLLETLPGALFVVDGAATIVYANASAQTMLGATREDVLGKPLWRGAPQLVSTALYQAVQKTNQTRKPTEVEYVSPVTGTWLHVQLAPTVGGLMVQFRQGRAATGREASVSQDKRLSLEDLDGLLSRIGVLTPEGIVLEINEVPLAQARARREDVIGHPLAEAEIHTLIDAIPQLVWIMRPDGSYDSFNQRAYDYSGLSPEEAQGEGWMQCLHPEDRPRVRSAWQHAVQTGGVYKTELRLRQGTTGEYCWFLSRAMPMRDATGQILKWFGTCTDIEDQKRVEEALLQSQKRANALMNSNIIGINVIEGEQMVDANDTFLHMTGYTREDLRAGRMNVMHMTAPEDLARTRQAHQELATQQALTPYEKEYLCQDGSRLPVLVGGVLLQHHPPQAIGFALDNSARKELEQRKDTFISMASHELRTPLTALKLQATLLHQQLARHGTLDQAPALASMEAKLKTITRLVEELLDVSKIQAGRLEYVQEPVDLDVLLREIADMMQQAHPSHTIVVRGAVQTSLIGDRDRLGQVFTNLLSNAIKYSPDAETVEVNLSTSEDVVMVSVHDHGLGIPRELRAKIFERFYRVTDPRRKAISGLGMGLSIVADIVKGHGGNITVDGEVGKGSTFTVTFPKRRAA